MTDARQPALSRERILDAAETIVADGGLEGLSMRRLAGELGVGTMSLYHYVKDKGELLDELGDRVLTGLDLPPEGAEWLPAVRTLALSMRRIAVAQPALFPLVLNRRRASGLEATRRLAALFESAGFPADEAFYACASVLRYVGGWSVGAVFSGPRTTRLARAAASEQAFTFGLDALLTGLQAALADRAKD